MNGEQIHRWIASIVRLALLIAVAIEIVSQRWALLFVTLVILLLTFLPTLFERRYHIDLPIELEVFTILFIYASLYLGEVLSFYRRIWWWDAFLHIASGIALGLAGLMVLLTLYRGKTLRVNPAWIAIFAFCFAMALGAVWEIFEFTMDQLVGTTMQKSGLIDTMWDLIVDALGALFVSILGYFYIKHKRVFYFSAMLDRFKKDNKALFVK